MMLYNIIDGAYLGFYREYGGTVFISGYRSIVKKQWIVRKRLEEVFIEGEWVKTEHWIDEHEVERLFWVPGYEEKHTEIVPGKWIYNQIYIEGHYEPRRFWIEEVCWYESKTVEMMVLGEMRPVTRMVEVCEPAHWGVRQYWIAGWWREIPEWVPEHELETTLWIDGHDEIRMVTIPLHVIEIPVKRPDRYEFMEIESGAWEDVEVEDPIYSYYGERDEYKLIDRDRGPVMVIAGVGDWDVLYCRVTATGGSVTFKAKFICCAVSIGENQYVNPN